MRVHHCSAATRVIAASIGQLIIHLSVDGSLRSQWRQLAEEDSHVRRKGNSPWLDHVADRLRAYFAGDDIPDWSDVPTPEGPEFQRRCWEACRKIPHGEVRSYAELAEMAGSRMASRAAGQAMRCNPLAVIVPCHRVVASDGKLHGYAGTTNSASDALSIKRGLLALEALCRAHGRSLIFTPGPGRRMPFKTETHGSIEWNSWGLELDPASIEQMRNACELPVTVSAAMPDAHVGYGLPIGGVLATDNAVIPYAVGVDIACRMKLSVLDLPVRRLRGQVDRLSNAIKTETSFGMGARWEKKRDHPVLQMDWSVSPVTRQVRDKAWWQLGTSGSGNHFVEFGRLTLDEPDLGLAAGEYIALLSHSGSRGAGFAVANHYSNLAMEMHPELPKPLRHLAWLDLDTDPGREYWAAMELMGAYASANHAIIHEGVVRRPRCAAIAGVENHHNFAWKENHGGREVIVHRKGATPAGAGVLGIIPGSMADPGFIVRGKGSAPSLNSASHGAGRAMSRSEVRRSFRWSHVKKLLAERDVTLLSAGLDDAPMAYKDIRQVMSQQDDLVDVVGRFDPLIVRMAPDGERAED